MKQKRKVFFTIGDDLQPSHKMHIVSAGKFTKKSRGLKSQTVQK